MSSATTRTSHASVGPCTGFGESRLGHLGYGPLVVVPRAPARKPEPWEKEEKFEGALPSRSRKLYRSALRADSRKVTDRDTGQSNRFYRLVETRMQNSPSAPVPTRTIATSEARLTASIDRGATPTTATTPRPAPSASPAMHLEHLQYLVDVSSGEGAPITRATAMLAHVAWQSIWLASGRAMPVPAACTGPDGQMFYAWDCGRHHLELDIAPGKDAEFFYRDRETDQLWCEDYKIGGSLPDEAVAKLRFFR